MIKKFLKYLASLKLAVIVLVALAVVTAWGTFVEAKYDAAAAQKLVFKSIWMYLVMGVLAVNLIAVMVDRWPWKKKHTGFLLAHIGIIILMLGSLLTSFKGIDGSLSFGVGDSARHVIVPETDLSVYTSSDGVRYTKLFDREVDFFLQAPRDNPVEIGLPNGSVRVIDYFPYAIRESQIVPSKSDRDGAAIRFQLQNSRVSVTEWLMHTNAQREVIKDLGPAQVVFTKQPFLNLAGRNTIVLRPVPGADHLDYEIHTVRLPGKIKKGVLRAGDSIDTGWMELKLRMLKILPHAKEEVTFRQLEAPTPLTTAAVKVDYNGEIHWVGINSILKLFSDQAVYIFTYANRRLDIGFDLKLKDFKIGRYQGTMRAASYESLVEVPGMGEQLISMNEPLKFNGFTFYQASFQEDEQGRVMASVLSVNRDPGRWVKYLGSLLIVLGTMHLFYLRRRKSPIVEGAAAKGLRAAAKVLVLAMLNIGLVVGTQPAAAASAKESGTEALRYLPVQDAGRVKPYDTFARETLQLIYGAKTYKSPRGTKHSAVEIVTTWMLVPQHWDDQAIVQISHRGLKEALRLAIEKKHFSPKEVFSQDRLGLVLQELNSFRQSRQKLTPYFQAVQTLENQLSLYQAIKQGEAIRLVPPPESADAATPSEHPPVAKQGEPQKWRSIVELDPPLRDAFTVVTRAFIQALPATAGQEPSLSNEASEDPSLPSLAEALAQFRDLARAQNPSLYPQERDIAIEVHYQSFHPFLITWVLYLLAAIVLAFSWQTGGANLYRTGWILTIIGFMFHNYGFGLRMYLTGRPPVSNMYESVIWVGWGTIFFSMIFEILGRRRFILMAGAVVGTLCLIVADLAPTVLDASLQPLEPVLRSNLWLTVHVLTISISYSAFFLAWGLANFGLFYVLRGESPDSERLRMVVQSIYRSLQVGVVLLAAGTILGGVWADYSWGRFWGWDPKETWALIALLGYLAVLHGRLVGWVRNLGMMVSSIIAFNLVIMAWYGVNFVLGAGLHSYGFGAGGIQYVSAFVILNLIYAGYATYIHNQSRT